MMELGAADGWTATDSNRWFPSSRRPIRSVTAESTAPNSVFDGRSSPIRGLEAASRPLLLAGGIEQFGPAFEGVPLGECLPPFLDALVGVGPERDRRRGVGVEPLAVGRQLFGDRREFGD